MTEDVKHFDVDCDSSELAVHVLKNTNGGQHVLISMPLGDASRLLQRMRMQITRMRKRIEEKQPEKFIARFNLKTSLSHDQEKGLTYVKLWRNVSDRQNLLTDMEKLGIIDG